MTTTEPYFEQDAIIKQAHKVKHKKSCGIDGVSAKEAVRVAEVDYLSIREEILTGSYKPKNILKVFIPKSNGKFRIIGSATVRDRIAQGCIHNYIYDVIDDEMSEDSYGFRNNRNCQKAVLRAVNIIEDGYEWIISIDLKDCFENLDKHLILWLLQEAEIDKNIIKNINNIISNNYISNSKEEPVKGCPQGSNISPDLCNLVLNQLDKILEERGHPFIRYADDIYIFCKSEAAANRILLSISKFLEKKLKLPINREKSCVFHSKDKVWSCLGFLIKNDADIHILMNPKKEENLRMNIKRRINDGDSDKLIQDINSLTCGWICCNSIADIGKATKRMDAYIKRSIRSYEIKYGVKLDVSNLKNCHDYYKKVLQRMKDKRNEPDSVGNANPKQCNKQPQHVEQQGTEISLSARAPPESDSL